MRSCVIQRYHTTTQTLETLETLDVLHDLLQESTLPPRADELAHDLFIDVRLTRDRGGDLGRFNRRVGGALDDNVMVVLS